MAFDNKNKVSKRELTPELVAEIEGKVNQIDFSIHVANTEMHTSKEEKDIWNAAVEIVNQLINPDTGIEQMLEDLKNSLADIAITGSWNDLKNIPSTVTNPTRVNGVRLSIGTGTPSSPVNDTEVWLNKNRNKLYEYTNGAWKLIGGVYK